MTYASLFAFARKPAAPPHWPGDLDADMPVYVAGLISALVNRAVDTGSFRGAIPDHPGIALQPAAEGSDEGTRAEMGLAVIATATCAAITVAHTDAARLGFLAVSPLHKDANGYNPDWQFDDPDAAMTARIRLRGLEFEIACINDPDGAATIALTLEY